MQLRGTSAIVTGAASGLGAATAAALAGAGVAVVGLDLAAGWERAAVVPSGITRVDGDVTSPQDVAAAVTTAAGTGAPLRIAVNCAGVAWASRILGRKGVHDLDLFRTVVGINLVGTFDCIRIAATAMSRNELTDTGERGAIVNMTSVAAFDGQIGQAAYSSSKGGVVGLTLPVARDLSAAGIRVNTVAPGLIDTPIYGEGEASEAFKAKLGESVLFPHRLGKPEELASMVVELLTNSYMNAEVVRVDGGIRMPPK